MWPIEGPDLKKSLQNFLSGRLRISGSALADMGNISIKKVFAGPKAKIQNEIVAVFATAEIRDTIRRAAKELAGDPLAGIRLEIPGHLQSSLKPLEAVSFALKKKHPGLRRNVKFDDSVMDLVLDFSVDPDGGAPWRKLRPSQALAVRSKMKGGDGDEVGEEELETMLCTGSTDGGEKSK